CFKGGYIDAWGRGIEKILSACRIERLPEPEFEENSGGMMVTLFSRRDRKKQQDDAKTGQVAKAAPEVTTEVGTKLALSRHQVEIIHKCLVERRIGELMVIAERSDRTKFRNQVLNPLLEAKLIEMTMSDKPTSSKQKYKLTEKGKKIKANL
ncbi:MAG: transcriptional regulator, partial [Elusimicrobiota bacterium]|nr:transcriptional regulator [Elusimicrobiota bacterium]